MITREKGGEGMNWEIDIYIPLCPKQITDKDLLYNAGNSIQYAIMTYMGIESKKGQIHVYVQLNHCAIHMKLTHFKSTILQ